MQPLNLKKIVVSNIILLFIATTAQADIFGASQSASDVSIDDAGSYYSSTTVEGALQEIGSTFSGGLAPKDATYITQTANSTLTAEQALSGLSTGLAIITNGTGVISTTTNNSSNWDTAYGWGNPSGVYLPIHGTADAVSGLTITAGASISGSNTGDQTLSSLGAQAQLNGTGFVKASGTSISYDNSTYLTTVTAHNLLSTTHGDTLADNVVRGDIVYGNATPKWARLAFPATPTGKVIQATATDVAWSSSALGTAAFAATGDFLGIHGKAETAGAADTATSAGKSTNLIGGNSTTLLGSIPYQSNTDTTLFINNPTSTKKYLVETGSAPNGAAPIFDTIAAGDVPTLNQDTTGSAVYWKTSGTGKASLTGPATGTTRAKTVRDADDTIMEVGGNYNPTGTWNWVSGSPSVTWPTFNQDTSGTAAKATNLKGGNSTTKLGYIPYQSDTDTTLFVNNTTTTKKFLRETGDGTNGGVPAFDTLISTDIPDLSATYLPLHSKAETAGTADLATQVSTTTKSDNVDYYLTFVGANSTSSQGIDVSGIKINPSTSTITATNFAGNASTSSSCSGNAGTVTNGVYTSGNQSIAGIKTFSDTTEATNATTGGTIVSGGLAVAKRVYATDMTVTNKITGSISGNCDGNAGGSSASCTGNSATVTIADESADTSCYPLFATTTAGSLAPKTNANLTYNSNTGMLSTTGLTVGSATDLLKITSGIVAAIGSPVKNYIPIWNGTTVVWAASGTTFTFSIATFTNNGGSTTVEIGSGVWKAIGALSFSATYNNGTPDATPYVDKTSPAWASNLNMTGAGYVGPTTNAEAVNYPASVAGTRSFVLHANIGAETSTSTSTFTFLNYRFWGKTTKTSGYTEADVEGLAGSELSNSGSKTFSSTTGSGEYVLWASRTALGTRSFTVDGLPAGVQAPETVSVTTASGFTENYYVYRFTNPNLATITVAVT